MAKALSPLGSIALLFIVLTGSSIHSIAGEQEGETISFWPPIGTKAGYYCSKFFLVPLLMAYNYPEVLQALADTLNVGLDMSSEYAITTSILDINDRLSNESLGLSCYIEWSIEDFNGSYFTIDVSLRFRLIRLNELPNSTFKWLGDEYRFRVYVSYTDRSTYTDEGFIGLWPFFLLPWELYEGNNVSVVYNSIYPFKLLKDARLEKAKNWLKNLEELLNSGKLLDSKELLVLKMRELSIPFERTLRSFSGLKFYSSNIPEEVKKEYDSKLWRYETADITLEEFESILLNTSSYKGSTPPVTIVSYNALFDTETGILLYYTHILYPMDLFSSLFRLSSVGDPLNFSPPQSIVIDYLILGNITQITLAKEKEPESSTSQPPEPAGNTSYHGADTPLNASSGSREPGMDESSSVRSGEETPTTAFKDEEPATTTYNEEYKSKSPVGGDKVYNSRPPNDGAMIYEYVAIVISVIALTVAALRATRIWR